MSGYLIPAYRRLSNNRLAQWLLVPHGTRRHNQPNERFLISLPTVAR
jgi:hypothetical protein